MIIDFHTHAYPDAIAQKGVQYVANFYDMDLHLQDGTVADLRASARDAGVDKLVMLSVAVRADQVMSINNWLSSQLDENTFGFGTLHPGYDKNLEEIDRFSSLHFTGAKLHPDMQQFYVDDPSMFPVYEKLEQLGLPLIVHSGDDRYEFSSPKRLVNVLERFPQLTVVAAHLGGYRCWDEVQQYLCGRENLYFDTSSSLFIIEKQQAVDIIRQHGADHILFGTDYPVTKHKDELDRLYSLGLEKDELQKILGENAKRLLGI